MTSKRKTKQLRWLVTGLMLAMTMVMPASTWANVMYTVYEDGTLTFKYGDSRYDWTGIVYDVPTDPKTSPGWLAKHKYSIKTVVFHESFKDARPTSCYEWFHYCIYLTSIKGIEYLNTEEVTNMSFMFYGCQRLTSLDVSKFNTAKVENMSNMFDNCQRLTSLDVSKFNTAKVTDMGAMFDNCLSLTSLDVSKFNTDNVTKMLYMFDGCKKLTSLDVSKFNTAEVTDMCSMFGDCELLTSLDVSKFNTAKVTNMSYMFGGCSGLTSLDVSKFNTDKVTSMGSMFSGCSGLTSLDVSKFNTDNVTNMGYMFNGCSGLTSLNLSNFDTSNVTDMYWMFNGCQKLTSLDLSSFNTAEVTDMRSMFAGCSGLTTIYVSDDFKTGNVSSSDEMFSGCSKLVGAASYSKYKIDQSMANYNTKTGYFKTYFTLGDSKVELCGEPLTTKSLNLTDNYDFTPKYEFKANEATYSRDLSSSNSTWFSLCLPFAYTPANFNFTAYQLKGATANAVEIEEITGTIAAGTPVLFKFNDGVKKEINISETKAEIKKAPFDGAKVNGPDGSSLQLCGTYQTKTFTSEDGNAFILLNNKLMNPAKMPENVTTVGVKPFRAYMTLTASTQTSSARAFSIGHGGEEGTTAIDLLNSIATDDAEYYDINGRRIDAPVKGVNIVRRGNKTIKLIIK
ncbi:hypothetical protein CIK99_00635 [Prevotella sp. P5-92]|uniref:BspA family leucine-rich repeat surface protein n=1 Tax=Prevotella sp. P5-92 TaxID=2024222 RepID=UPI000B967C12|nr:BspA family leucine-rich repeat surface protein [Prevotella sp. P5-92]OYP59918.1 hypothetical protein CIK99_00635 [Prevotella sp. P5-92]